MSRSIKFRGQREDTKEWVYGSLIEDKYIVGNVIDWNEDYFNTEYWWRVIPETVGQFTGWFDIKGKSIYEGDIIKHCGKNYVISWDFFQWSTKPEGKVSSWPMCNVGTVKSFEKVGNVHDNGQTLHTCNEKPCYYVTID